MLTYKRTRADTGPATAKSVAGFGDPNKQGGHTATSAVFLCLQKGKSFYGRAIRETFGSAGNLVTGSPTCMVSPTLLARGRREYNRKQGMPR